MGLSPFHSFSTYDKPAFQPRPPNPDPKNFTINAHEQIGKFLIVLVRYPDCTSYEGNKILVFEGCTINSLIRQGTLDPHFSENSDFFSPVMRFEPTSRGLFYAKVLCHKLTGKAEPKED